MIVNRQKEKRLALPPPLWGRAGVGGGQSNASYPPPQPSRTKGQGGVIGIMKWIVAAGVAGSLLFAHGCHGDEDHELFGQALVALGLRAEPGER